MKKPAIGLELLTLAANGANVACVKPNDNIPGIININHFDDIVDLAEKKLDHPSINWNEPLWQTCAQNCLSSILECL